MDQPPRDFLRIDGGIGFARRFQQRFAAFQERAQRTDTSPEAGGEIGSTSTAPRGIGKVRLGGDRCHRLKTGGALSPSKPAKYTMKPLRLRRVMAYDERLQSTPRN